MPKESYVARIGVHDHSTPTTKKYLRLANDRIGQDRANYHRFKIRDAEDQGDGMFHDKKERKWFYKKLAEPYAIPAKVKRAVDNGATLIPVDVYSSHVKVSLVNQSVSAAPGTSTDHLVGETPAQDPGLWLNSHPMGSQQARSRGITNFSNVCWMDTGTGVKRIQKAAAGSTLRSLRVVVPIATGKTRRMRSTRQGGTTARAAAGRVPVGGHKENT